MASMRSFVLHASIHFLGSEDVLTVIESNVNSIVDCFGIFALQGEDIGKKSVHTRIGHRGVTMGIDPIYASQPSLAAISSQSHLLPTRNSSQCLERCASRVVSLRYLSKQALQQNCFHPKRCRTRPKRPLHMSHRRLLTLFEPGTMKEICAL